MTRSLPSVYVTGSDHRPAQPNFLTPDPETWWWETDPDAEGCEASLYVNSAIRREMEQPDGRSGKKIAWISESPAISEKFELSDFVRHNASAVATAFDEVLMCDRRLCALHPKFRFHPAASNLPWIHEYGLYEKSRLCSMFLSPKKIVPAHHFRHQIAERYQDSVDFFGGPFNSRHLLNKHEGMLPYRFSIAMENSNASLYYTEKLTDCFATGTVPIYWGTPDIGEIFDINGVILLDDQFDIGRLSEALYQEMLPSVRRNLEIVKGLESSFDELYRKYIK